MNYRAPEKYSSGTRKVIIGPQGNDIWATDKYFMGHRNKKWVVAIGCGDKMRPKMYFSWGPKIILCGPSKLS